MSPDSTRLRKSSTEVFLGMKGAGDGEGAADDDDGVEVPELTLTLTLPERSLLDPPTPPAGAAI